MNKQRFYGIIVLLVLIGSLFYLMFSPNGKQEKIDLATTTKDVIQEINVSKEYVKKTTDWMGKGNDGSEDLYFHPPRVKNNNQDQKKDVVKYFIAGLMTNDADIFMSNFYVQTISEDLFKTKTPDKTEVVKEIMNRISRNGQVKEVRYADKKGIFNSETDKLTLILVYKDNKQANITIQVLPVHVSHKESGGKILVIKTSAWDIIKQIETRTSN